MLLFSPANLRPPHISAMQEGGQNKTSPRRSPAPDPAHHAKTSFSAANSPAVTAHTSPMSCNICIFCHSEHCNNCTFYRSQHCKICTFWLQCPEYRNDPDQIQNNSMPSGTPQAPFPLSPEQKSWQQQFSQIRKTCTFCCTATCKTSIFSPIGSCKTCTFRSFQLCKNRTFRQKADPA